MYISCTYVFLIGSYIHDTLDVYTTPHKLSVRLFILLCCIQLAIEESDTHFVSLHVSFFGIGCM
jgi:hypothetical protein